ncbi:MAG: VacJ family lipoprotein [Desulfohalobiaceae bacterium]
MIRKSTTGTSAALLLLVALLVLGGCAARNNAAGTAVQGPATAGGGTAGAESDPEADVWDEEWETLAEEERAPRIADPLEGWNRAMFTFNDKLYFYLLKPVSRTYALFVPEALRTGISNIFENLAYPVRAVNCVLQGKGEKAAKETGSFALNTTFGFLGLVKISDSVPELAVSPEDTGQTLGAWGAGNGFYIVWPVFGASTLRDSFGRVGDHFLDPITYVDPSDARWALRGGDRVNETSLRLGEYEDLKEGALDPYVALRDAYLQYRRNLVED